MQDNPGQELVVGEVRFSLSGGVNRTHQKWGPRKGAHLKGIRIVLQKAALLFMSPLFGDPNKRLCPE